MDGVTEGPERGAGGVKLLRAEGVEFEEGHCSPSLLGSLDLCIEKNSKINFEIAYFLQFCELKWPRPRAVSATLSIRQYNCYLCGSRQIWYVGKF